jgi:hypothetical protein
MSRCLTTVVAVLAVLVAPSAAGAAWTHSDSGNQTARARTMPTGATPTASVSNRSVTVSWSGSTIGGSPVSGYVVKRYNTGGTLQTIGSGCSGTVSATSCTETGVPPGSWRYSVTPKQGNWLGTESSRSTAVTVASPTLTLSGSTTLTALPGTLSATLANFVSGQTVTYRLDNASTGTVLTATTTPSTIPAGGGATASITIPAGTSNGSHTVYAVGSGGSDAPSASFTVSVPFTLTTSAWDLRDLSSGTEVNATAQTATAGDGRTFNTGAWPTAFSTSRYIEFDFDGPFPSGQSVSGATFNFRRAAAAAGDTTCFYFDVRRASGGGVPVTHGSSASPVGCVTGTTLTTTSTPLPEIADTDTLDDLRVRIYVQESAAQFNTIDMATVSATTASTSVTTNITTYTDASSGTPSSFPWTLDQLDSTMYETSANWPTSFASADYLKLTFPAYIPSGTTVSSATLRNSYRPSNSANTACYWVDVYAGSTPIGTHGSTSSPYACGTGSSYTTDSITLSEVNTPARANTLVVRLYYRSTSGGSRRTQHDRVQLSVDYTP